jgi:hypothetical protein
MNLVRRSEVVKTLNFLTKYIDVTPGSLFSFIKVHGVTSQKAVLLRLHRPGHLKSHN